MAFLYNFRMLHIVLTTEKIRNDLIRGENVSISGTFVSKQKSPCAPNIEAANDG